ncbi:MAG: homocysteine S-methyltransferase family protein [Proteobacteria bacterium]|nr:homocysteine S-methyltransferase family protein [Pseudomonadota bacterium]
MVTILDGGMGRELKRIGAPFRQPEWSALAMIEAPDMVGQVHAAYIAAGARVITTNSYALVPFHIGAERFAAEGEALAARAGQVARAAATPGVRVAGSLPPLFGSYRPDLFDAAGAQALLAPLIAGLAPHVDLWLAETLSACAEAEAAAMALAGQPQPRWFSFTLADGNITPGDAPRLRSGEPVEAAVQTVLAAGGEALLFNCSQPEVMEAAVRAALAEVARVGAALQVGVYANAFPPQSEEATANETLLELRPDLDPPGYLGWVRRWHGAGASILGGCCGISPEHIAAITLDLVGETA